MKCPILVRMSHNASYVKFILVQNAAEAEKILSYKFAQNRTAA
ncbi:hypothetical protein LX82_02847 [Celeribacter halophilus]|uniref:Uncharacterized protein n=1 Tax=Celeribacter halophilus TaxID=576117 RepID=A0A1I3V8P7_9RHOB|nr:hypothetical protein LX82_02847 [Celeribacter halophilus]SFJ91333.1 hypothetical protein SAMN04488138_1144 [Celeribacter halophilus]